MPRLPLRPPRPLSVSLSAIPSALAQLATLLIVAIVGAGLLFLSGVTTSSRPAAVAGSFAAGASGSAERATSDLHESVPHSGAARRTPAAAPASASSPAHRSRQATPGSGHGATATPASVHRWLPTGTGIWTYQWDRTDGGNAHAIVRRAERAHLTTLYVRTGSSHDGFTGGPVLRQLLPAVRGTGLHVVAWDFPELRHPKRDARRLADAAWYLRGSGSHVAAVAPDIETPAEGTHLSGEHVNVYLKTLRALLPNDVAILGTVPWPSSARVGHYPYGAVAFRSDALLPMAYWYDNSPVDVTKTSIEYLARFHRPVLPVGQGYDGRLDVPWLPHNNLKKQVPAFLATAHRLGARAVSLWSWEAAPKTAWHALGSAHRMFPAQH